jgi:predicted double-glycine peptidase
MTSWISLLLLQAALSGPWLDVPFVHQGKDGCGSASIWMLIQYWKKPARTVEEIQHDLYSRAAHGIYASDMERYLKEQGFQTFVLTLKWDDLSEHVAQGRPLIVCLERNSRGVPLHYVVVTGIDRDRDVVWLNDPAIRKLLPMRREDFERQWGATENWALLAIPESAPVAVSAPSIPSHVDSPQLQLASAAFRLENFPEAEKQLRTILRSQPDDLFTNDFLGTTYQLDDNFDAALKYWNRADKPRLREIQIEPPLKIDPVRLDTTFAFSRASVLTSKTYEETRQRLDSLGIFSQYRIELTPTNGDDFDMTFRATEKTGPRFLSWIRGLPYQTVYPGWWNAGGRAINIESLIRWDSNNRRGRISLSSPLRQSSNIAYRLQADVRNENWLFDAESFNLRRSEFSADIRATLHGGWIWTSGANVVHRAFSNSFTGGNSVSYRTAINRTIVRVPERRLAIESSLSTDVGKLFSATPERFLKLQGDLSLNWTPFSRHHDDYKITVRLRSGEIFGQLPFDELFILGLDRDSDLRLRAHPALDSGQKGSAPMGRGFVLLNSEVSKRVYSNGLFRFEAGPFLDSARIASQPQVLVDAGVQLRVSVLSGLTLGVSFGRDLRAGRHAIFID